MRLGIRLQILLALGALLAFSFVPLYFAVSRLAEASLASVRRDASRDLGRAIGGHVLAASEARTVAATRALLEAQLSEEGVIAIAVYDARGKRAVSAGEAERLPEELMARAEVARPVDLHPGRGLFVAVPAERGNVSVAMVLTVESKTLPTAPLVGLVALYIGVVALLLLIVGYLALTRLVVRPVEDLARAAGRVASSTMSPRLDDDGPSSAHEERINPLTSRPPSSARGGVREADAWGARELVDLRESLAAMTEKLLADERSLRAKVDELERTTKELRATQAAMVRSERLASVGRLAAGMAHEIGNPIAAILGFEELLLSGDLQPAEQRDFLLRMKKETERINRVLRDLLDFARPTAGRAESADAEARADVAEVVTDVVGLVGPQRDLKDVTIEVDIDHDIPALAIHAERLKQVILNLVLNAGDVVPSPTGRITVRARREGDFVRIEVEDNGPGIPPELRAKLFEPFVTTKEVGKGTGLGLAVCRGLVEAAGGTIAAEEVDSGGARFVVRMPRAS